MIPSQWKWLALLLPAAALISAPIVWAQCCGGSCGRATAPACAATAPKAAKTPVAAPPRLAAALKAIDEAHKAVKAGNREAALAALVKARGLLALEARRRAARPAANATCPMTGKPVNANYTRTYNGRTIGFCGPGCAAHWDRAPEARRAALAAKIAPATPAGAPVYANITCPIIGSKIDPTKVTPALTRTFKNEKVAFCCAGCPAAWDRLSGTEKATKLAKARAK